MNKQSLFAMIASTCPAFGMGNYNEKQEKVPKKSA
jgi:hypothetical protein